MNPWLDDVTQVTSLAGRTVDSASSLPGLHPRP